MRNLDKTTSRGLERLLESYRSDIKEAVSDNPKLFVVITQGGFIGGNSLNGKIFTSKEEAKEACKQWKDSFGRNKSYYQPKTAIYVYRYDKPNTFDRAIKRNEANKEILKQLSDQGLLYTPKISDQEVLDFLKSKGFNTSSHVTQEYARRVTDELSVYKNPSLEDWYEDAKRNDPMDLRYLPKLKEAFSPSRFSETLDDSDYQDFLHSLSEVVTKESKKWKNRGISISDVCHALDELGVRFEDLSDEDIDESLDFKTMPIPKEGATFAFRATVDEPEVSSLLQKKNLKFDKVNENGTIVWLIGHGDTDHIATYVPSTKTLYTSTRELFREAFSPYNKSGVNESLSSRDETKVRILLNKRIPRSDVVEDIIDVINQSPLNTTKDKLRLEKRVRDIYPVDDWAMENIILAYALLNK